LAKEISGFAFIDLDPGESMTSVPSDTPISDQRAKFIEPQAVPSSPIAKAPETLLFQDLHVGDQWWSEEREVTDVDIVDFAELTGDHDPLHLDASYAEDSPFGRRIAHGLLGLSYMAGLSSCAPRVKTVALMGVEQWNFLQPIYIGDRIRVHTSVESLTPHGRNHGIVRWRRQVVNDREQVVQEGILVTMVAARTIPRRVAKTGGEAIG
jgi:acyl dehydratase